MFIFFLGGIGEKNVEFGNSSTPLPYSDRLERVDISIGARLYCLTLHPKTGTS